MTLTELFLALNGAGIKLAHVGGQLQLRGPSGAITHEITASAREHKATILGLLAPPVPTEAIESPRLHPDPAPSPGLNIRSADSKASGSLRSLVRIGDRPFSFDKPWDGGPLTDRDYLAFDTETELIVDERQIPRLVLASASAGGDANCLLRPEQVGRFILTHPHAHFVFHNVAFDFWVVDRHLVERGEESARQAWWDACDQNRMSDTMLLDQLIELARCDADPRPRDLATIGQLYAGLEISKEDPYRLRYGEIIGRDWAEIEEGFFTYAIMDPIVTIHAYRKMMSAAHDLMDRVRRSCPDLHEDAIAKFGLLSEFVQVKGSVALAQVSRPGMHLDQDLVRATEAALRSELDKAVESLRTRCPNLFKTRKDRKTGQVVLQYSKQTGAPAKSQKVLQQHLEAIGATLAISIPYTARGLSTSVKVWLRHAKLDPFLEDWIAVEELSKLCQFFAGMRASVVYPRYRALLRTGRTSCTGPNIQQVPRDGRFRSAFVASPGRFLLAIDYAFIELRTLAAVCLQRYGRSVLADVIRQGIDPHAYTAAMIQNVPLDKFMNWKDDDKEVEINGVRKPLKRHFKEARQFAKPINFGVPGGLGAASLVDYARNTYKVEMTLEQAQAFRAKLINQIYPELGLYLAEDDMALLAYNLGASVEDLWNSFDRDRTRRKWVVSGIRNIVRGKPLNSHGKPYDQGYRDRVWNTLIAFCKDPELRSLLVQREGCDSLCNRLFRSSVVTLTGRIRGGINYSQCRNTPFQGLAADGAKLALWRLIREGFSVIGFIHDEILIELLDEGGYVSQAATERAQAIMCEEMEAVLLGGIQVGCEATLSRCWSKDAGSIVRDGRIFPSPVA
jgi:hypothetical protein